jgi:hypothetical protein
MTKQEHVPGTRSTEVKPNREQRRHPEGLADAPIARDEAVEAEGPRTKTAGRKKKTADKWNQ